MDVFLSFACVLGTLCLFAGVGAWVVGLLRLVSTNPAERGFDLLDRAVLASGRAVVVLLGIALGIVGGIGLIVLALIEWPRAERPQPAVSTPERVWERYTTPDGRCSAEFPEEPHYGWEGSLQTKSFSPIFTLHCTPIPAEWEGASNEVLFDMLRDNMIGNGGDEPNELTVEREIVVDGCIGREWVFSQRKRFEIVMRVKAFIREGRLYQVAALSMMPDQDDQDMKRFLDSFRFEKPKSE